RLGHGGCVENAGDGAYLGKVIAPLSRAPDDAEHAAGTERHLDEGARETAALGRAVVERAAERLGREDRDEVARVVKRKPGHARALRRGSGRAPFALEARPKAPATYPASDRTRAMKFFVDTADTAAIKELNDLGMVDGVTTNPSLILKAGRDILEVTKEICDMVQGPVSAEVVATEAREMIAEGLKLSKIAPNIAIKVPLTWDGLTACKAFAS